MSSHTKNTNPIRFVVSFVVVLTAAMTLGGVMHSCKNNAGDSTDLKVDISTSSAIIKNFSNDFMANLEGALLAAKVPAADVNSVLEEIRSSVSGLGLADADPNVGGLLEIALNAVKKVLSDAAATLLVSFVAHHTATGSADATVATTVANFADDHGVDVTTTQLTPEQVILAIGSNSTGSVNELLTAAAAVTHEDIEALGASCEAPGTAVSGLYLGTPTYPAPTELGSGGFVDATLYGCLTGLPIPQGFLKPCKSIESVSTTNTFDINLSCPDGGPSGKISINYPCDINCKDPASVGSCISQIASAVEAAKIANCPQPSSSAPPVSGAAN